jgi:hypothetical protein
MTGSRTVGGYQHLVRLYPRRFREEYGAEMARLLADQLRDEPASRVWVRTLGARPNVTEDDRNQA